MFLGMAAGAAGAATGGKVRAAILGVRHGHVVGKLRALRESPLYELAGVCEPDPALRREREQSVAFHGLRWLSQEELVGDAATRLVIVESGVAETVPYGLRAIAAGKHVHLEKPPSERMAPFRELVEEARAKNLLVQVGYIWRHHAGFAAAAEVLRKGWLGEVTMMRGTINTDLAAAAREPLSRFVGGMMFELGCHMIDRMVDLLGRPESVRSWLRHDTSFPDRLADNALAVFEYKRALAVIGSAARMAGSSQHRIFELVGTEGSIQIQPVEPGTRVQVMMREARGPYRAGWQTLEMPAQQRYAGDFEELGRAIMEGGKLRHSYDFELLVQETVLRACEA